MLRSVKTDLCLSLFMSLYNTVYGSLGRRIIPPPPLAAPSRGWASRLAAAWPDSCPACPGWGWPPAVAAAAACWAAAALAASWSCIEAAWWLGSGWCWLAEAGSLEAGKGHLNLGIPMRPSWGIPGTPAPGIPCTMAPGMPGIPPTRTPPPWPTPSIAATERRG